VAPVRDVFGTLPDGRAVECWRISDATGLTAAVLSYGAVLQSLWVPGPGPAREPVNVVLGFAGLEDYLERSPYFGCVVGRYANRIAGGRLRLEDREYELPHNDAERPNTLHGGPLGFHQRRWAASPLPGAASGIEFRLVSEHGDQGFPGRVEVTASYRIEGGALFMEYLATTDATTVVNLTNHSYFNLAGEGSGTVDGHVLALDASTYLPVDADLIPLSAEAPVAGTPFDFTRGAEVGARLGDPHEQLKIAGGYDHCFVLDGGRTDAPRRVGSLTDPASGLVMEVCTTEPGIQVYTSNDLSAKLTGTSGRSYGPRAAIALETQHFPDSPNRPDFPSTLLLPGGVYRSSTVLRFPHLA
jgi:aldose 1-epimerase